MANWNESHPLERAFHNLRSHAKERGKDFRLTLEEFKFFAEKTNYLSRRGKTSLSFSIDRIDNRRGYVANNIRCITIAENSRKLFTSMPDWMKEEIKALESGYIPESHRNLT